MLRDLRHSPSCNTATARRHAGTQPRAPHTSVIVSQGASLYPELSTSACDERRLSSEPRCALAICCWCCSTKFSTKEDFPY
jgi:hypothetical protein